MRKTKYRRFHDIDDMKIDLVVCADVLTIRGLGIPIDLDRPKARELAAILNHFADTGELPGEVGDDE